MIKTIPLDTFDGAKPRFLNRGKKRRSVSTLSIPRALVLSTVEGSDRGVEWVDSISLRSQWIRGKVGTKLLPDGRGCAVPINLGRLILVLGNTFDNGRHHGLIREYELS